MPNPHDFPRSASLNEAYGDAIETCVEQRFEFLTPEHLLLAIIHQPRFQDAMSGNFTADQLADLEETLENYIDTFEHVPENVDYDICLSSGMINLHEVLWSLLQTSSAKEISVPHVIHACEFLDGLYGPHLINEFISGWRGETLGALTDAYGISGAFEHENVDEWERPNPKPLDDDSDGEYQDNADDSEGWTDVDEEPRQKSARWKKMVECINDSLSGRNPLIGREAELARTIQVLCRKDKNNPLHVGEPGVGKTALVYGLARMIEEGRVPDRLKGSRIYRLDVGSLIAGTKFRGQLEEKLKLIMEGARSEPGSIVYIDEIHTIVGAGANSNEGMDTANQLKPYLESGEIRFIGSTTYEEYNRQFSKSKSLVRRFQQIDINEPSVEETIEILRQLKPIYEEFHNVKYTDTAIDFAVRSTARHIADRRLPDKAIDLVDEAGAFREINPGDEGSNTVDEDLISQTLARLCRVETAAVAKADEAEQLRTLTDRVLGRVFGQDEAVRGVTEAVMMSRAGLTDPEKPVASMLFVGPTGVGKTEVALALAEAMGVELVRFDMSEYTEKHTVAKLIGSPAGYVGYDDGGLLTDAIRKTPNCVLLLDEIEKAHPDIYNILLQVMDYGRLTDNKGNKADFRNVVIIMTSNAGAQHAAQASVGFGSRVTAADAMMREVKRLFKPEFLNRLSAMVPFNSLDREMAGRILDKKLARLEAMLAEKKVTLKLSAEAREMLLDAGVTRDNGARELDRVIAARLKPLLMREILFGKLREGGEARISLEAEGKLVVEE